MDVEIPLPFAPPYEAVVFPSWLAILLAVLSLVPIALLLAIVCAALFARQVSKHG